MQNLNNIGDSLLTIDEDIEEISIISSDVYNVEMINSFGSTYKHLRQQSKAP